MSSEPVTILTAETIFTDGYSNEEFEIPCNNLLCSKVFKKKCNLNKHMKICRFNEHPNKKYECFKCKMQLSRSDALKRHFSKCGIKKSAIPVRESSSLKLIKISKLSKDFKIRDFLKLENSLNDSFFLFIPN